MLVLACAMKSADPIPISPPIKKSHASEIVPLGTKQLRQNPPPEDCAVLPSTCIGTDSVRVRDGSLLSVAVKLTMKVWPIWLAVGVKEKAPVAGLNAILDDSPLAESATGPDVPVGSFPETVNRSVPPTVAFCGPGTLMMGRTPAEPPMVNV